MNQRTFDNMSCQMISILFLIHPLYLHFEFFTNVVFWAWIIEGSNFTSFEGIVFHNVFASTLSKDGVLQMFLYFFFFENFKIFFIWEMI